MDYVECGFGLSDLEPEAVLWHIYRQRLAANELRKWRRVGVWDGGCRCPVGLEVESRVKSRPIQP